MVAQGVMNKGKVYIVMEDDGIDSVWSDSAAAIKRRDAIDRICADLNISNATRIVVRKVR